MLNILSSSYLPDWHKEVIFAATGSVSRKVETLCGGVLVSRRDGCWLFVDDGSGEGVMVIIMSPAEVMSPVSREERRHNLLRALLLVEHNSNFAVLESPRRSQTDGTIGRIVDVPYFVFGLPIGPDR